MRLARIWRWLSFSILPPVLLCLFLFLQEVPVHGAARTVDTTPVPDTCATSLHSSSGTTTVQVCPAVVESGRGVSFVVHSDADQQVVVVLRYPNGQNDRQSGTTDSQGAVTLTMTVRYNPLYRYGQVPFLLTVGTSNVESVSGAIRVAQTTVSTHSRLRVKPANAKNWCPEDHCVVKDNTSVVLRVETDPDAQVQIALQYPNGETTSCPGNDLGGGGGAFADSTGAYMCRLPVYYDLPNAHATVTVVVQVTITTSTATIPLQYKLWLRAK